MSRSDTRTKGSRKINYSSRWNPEYLEWLQAEAARRTYEARMDKACELAGAKGGRAMYTSAKKMGTLAVLGPEVSVADVLHMAVDHYRSAG